MDVHYLGAFVLVDLFVLFVLVVLHNLYVVCLSYHLLIVVIVGISQSASVIFLLAYIAFGHRWIDASLDRRVHDRVVAHLTGNTVSALSDFVRSLSFVLDLIFLGAISKIIESIDCKKSSILSISVPFVTRCFVRKL